jgi:hypothetical protein
MCVCISPPADIYYLPVIHSFCGGYARKVFSCLDPPFDSYYENENIRKIEKKLQI